MEDMIEGNEVVEQPLTSDDLYHLHIALKHYDNYASKKMEDRFRTSSAIGDIWEDYTQLKDIISNLNNKITVMKELRYSRKIEDKAQTNLDNYTDQDKSEDSDSDICLITEEEGEELIEYASQEGKFVCHLDTDDEAEWMGIYISGGVALVDSFSKEIYAKDWLYSI